MHEKENPGISETCTYWCNIVLIFRKDPMNFTPDSFILHSTAQQDIFSDK